MAKDVNLSEPLNNGQPTVLCVDRLLFEKDLQQLRRRTDLNWVSLDNQLFSRIQEAWCPTPMREQNHYINFTGKQYDRAREMCNIFCVTLLEHLLKRAKIDAVMSPMFDYWQDESLRHACTLMGIPFLVLTKEHCTTRDVYQYWLEYYKDSGFVFNGDAVAVFGELSRTWLIESGVCRPEHVWVTGPPRLDAWQDVELESIPRRNVVLLTFAGYEADDCLRDILKTYAALSYRCDAEECDYIVKCKHNGDKRNVEELLHGRNHALSLRVMDQLHDLLPTARAVIGFNSLALLEALLTKAKIVIPFFGDTVRENEALLISPQDVQSLKGVIFAHSLDELKEHIETAKTGRILTETDMSARRSFLYKHFHKPIEPTYSREVAAFVQRYIGRSAELIPESKDSR